MTIKSQAKAGRGLAIGGATFAEVKETTLKVSQSEHDVTSHATIASQGKWRRFIPGMGKASMTCSGNYTAADITALIAAINNSTVGNITWDPDGSGVLFTLDSGMPTNTQIESAVDAPISQSIEFSGGKVS